MSYISNSTLTKALKTVYNLYDDSMQRKVLCWRSSNNVIVIVTTIVSEAGLMLRGQL